jgi:hypothetical protein
MSEPEVAENNSTASTRPPADARYRKNVVVREAAL